MGGGSRMNEVACALDGCACRFLPCPWLRPLLSVEVGIVAEQSIPRHARGEAIPL